MTSKKRPLRGSGRTRKLLRRLPETVTGELIVELSVTGRLIRQAIRARTPNRSGALRAGVLDKVLPRSLRLQVGLLGTKRGRSNLFYGRIQDLGRSEQVVNVVRRAGGLTRSTTASGKPRMRRSRGKLTKGQLREVGAPYSMAVPAMPGKRFVTGRYPELRKTLNDNLRGIFARSIGKIAGGGDE